MIILRISNKNVISINQENHVAFISFQREKES